MVETFCWTNPVTQEPGAFEFVYISTFEQSMRLRIVDLVDMFSSVDVDIVAIFKVANEAQQCHTIRFDPLPQ